ncbi:MAG: hypothetical protein AAF518_26475, partial [Spirochaetota bacterium]
LNDFSITLTNGKKTWRTKIHTMKYGTLSDEINLVIAGKKPRESYYRIAGEFSLQKGIEDRVIYKLALYDRRKPKSLLAIDEDDTEEN